jgi:sec-independent protein translocase protein TatA
MGFSLISRNRTRGPNRVRNVPPTRQPLDGGASGYAGSVLGFLPTLGFSETVVLLVIGLLLFGRNLPQVGRTLGRSVAQLRRGLHEFKDQLDRDGSLREIKDAVRDTTGEIKRAAAVPRVLADPGRALRDLTNEALSSPAQSSAQSPAEPEPRAQAGTPAELPRADQGD